MTTPDPTPDLERAADLHSAGDLMAASAAYQRVLTAQPDAWPALHGLALIAIDLGQPDRALPLLARCIRAEPLNGMYLTSLGLAYLRKKLPEDAAAHLLKAANLLPRVLEPRLYLSRALGQMGRWGQAVDVLAASIATFPDRPEIWAAKGNAERALLRHTDAEQSLRAALKLSPRDSDILNNLGVVVRALNRPEEAVALYSQALAIAPERALTHANLGNVLAHLGRNVMAEKHLRQAVDLDPALPEARGNLAAFLLKQERSVEAIPHFREVLNASPRNVDAWTNLGIALLNTGDIAEAERCYRQAIALEPKNAEAHYNLAWVLLLTGRWQEGWQEYEWRWKLTNFSSRKRDFTQPLWTGDAQGTVLLHAEQGLGDAIQFVRYAAKVKQRCTRIIVECPPSLVKLFTLLEQIDVVVPAGDPLPDVDAHVPFMSLPRIFATTPETVPTPTAYIAAPAVISPALKLPDTGKKRIGLVWAGSPDNKIDRRRTLPAQLFAPLVTAVDADFVSLQVGPRAAEAVDLPAGKVVFTCQGRVADFAETAAVVAQLDLVLGVDTAVMHLAAAMGKPAWMLLPTMPDYRWLLDREDSPWYKSILLIRQAENEDWAAVLARTLPVLTNWQRLRV